MRQTSTDPSPSYITHRDTGWVTLRLPRAMSEHGKQALLTHLKQHFWQHGTFQWMNDNTLRLIAKRNGRCLTENLLILEGWARAACRHVCEQLNIAKRTR